MYALKSPFRFPPYERGIGAVASRAGMGHPSTRVGELCAEQGVSRRTLYCHVDPKGALPPNGEKLFDRSARRSCLILNSAEAGM